MLVDDLNWHIRKAKIEAYQEALAYHEAQRDRVGNEEAINDLEEEQLVATYRAHKHAIKFFQDKLKRSEG